MSRVNDAGPSSGSKRAGQFRAYNNGVAESLKVPADQFKAVTRALLNTPPSTQADMPRKREPKAPKRRAASKRR